MFFFFNDTATTEIYTLPLHDALPISPSSAAAARPASARKPASLTGRSGSYIRNSSCRQRTPMASAATANTQPPETTMKIAKRSEEHTSELQSRQYIVCRLLLEKKKTL